MGLKRDAVVTGPAAYRHIAFSGGRSSAYMLHRIVEEHGGLPDRARAVFANTGKEREETLDFVHRCGEAWGVRIDWVEYRRRPDAAGGPHDPRHAHAVVDHASASRRGEPFAALVRARGRLPSVLQRMCTQELKVRTADRFLRRECGWPKGFVTLLGIRHDEPRRWRKALFEECRVEYPMVDWRVTREDVLAFWRRMPFDLALPPESGWSNCDLCFLKGRRKLAGLVAHEPERLAWWNALEAETLARRALDDPRMARMDPKWSYAELGRQAPLPLGPEEPVVDCYCGGDL